MERNRVCYVPLWIVEFIDVSNVGTAVSEVGVIPQVEDGLLPGPLQPFCCVPRHNSFTLLR